VSFLLRAACDLSPGSLVFWKLRLATYRLRRVPPLLRCPASAMDHARRALRELAVRRRAALCFRLLARAAPSAEPPPFCARLFSSNDIRSTTLPPPVGSASASCSGSVSV